MNAKPNKVLLVLWKDWLDIRQQRGLMLSILLPPLIFAILPLVVFFVSGLGDPTGTNKDAPEALLKANPALAGMNVREMGQTIAGLQFSIIILIMPAILPSIIASYSVVGEKTERTL